MLQVPIHNGTPSYNWESLEAVEWFMILMEQGMHMCSCGVQ